MKICISLYVLIVVPTSCMSEQKFFTKKNGFIKRFNNSIDCRTAKDGWAPTPTNEWRICNPTGSSCSLNLQPIKIRPAIRLMVNVTIFTALRAKQNSTLFILKDSQVFKTYEVPGVSNRTKMIQYTLDDVTNNQEVSLIFRSKGFCGGLNRIDVYYYQCPNASKELVDFKKAQPAPSTGFKHIDGVCVDNSQMNNSTDKPYMNCHATGKMEMHGSCFCNYGYTNLPRKCQRKYHSITFLLITFLIIREVNK